MALAGFPIQPELTAVAIAYKNSNLIADTVLPYVPVGKQEFKYLKYAPTENFTIPETKVGRKSKPNQVEFTATEVTDSTVDYALDDPIPNVDIENAPPNFDPRARAVEGIMSLIKLSREQRVANLVFDDANYASGNKLTTLTTNTYWSDFSSATSDPIGNILAGLDACIMRPNLMVIGQAVWTKLRQHPKVVKAVLGNSGDSGIVSVENLRNLLEMEQIVIGQGWVNTAKKGQTATMSRLWGKSVAMLYRDSLGNAGAGTTFGFTARFGDPIAGAIEDPHMGMRGGVLVRAGESVKEVICANNLGYFIKDCVQ